jgi:hypothetical protein
VRRLDQLVEHLAQEPVVSVEARPRGLDVAVGVEPLPGDVVARVAGELREERPLRSAVAFAERMDRVQLAW